LSRGFGSFLEIFLELGFGVFLLVKAVFWLIMEFMPFWSGENTQNTVFFQN
jgi:hypothetical protein